MTIIFVSNLFCISILVKLIPIFILIYIIPFGNIFDVDCNERYKMTHDEFL
jgi:hypothetical protein